MSPAPEIHRPNGVTPTSVVELDASILNLRAFVAAHRQPCLIHQSRANPSRQSIATVDPIETVDSRDNATGE